MAVTMIPCLLVLVFSTLSCTTYGSPSKNTDVFVSPCPKLPDSLAVADPPFPNNGFKLWSKASNWPGSIVPGINSGVGANVTIPCGVAFLLDLPSIDVGLLRIQGLLRLKDDPSLPKISVKANFILVEGQLTIGTPSKQFSQKVVIELTPNIKGGRAALLFTSFPPADPANPRILGHKAFAVVGGQVHLHGLPGPSTIPVWTKLSKTADVDQDLLYVEDDVSGSWPAGSEIVIASTDYNRDQAEVFIIRSVTKSSQGSVIKVNQSLEYMHYGQPKSLSDGFGGYVEQRGEVALLSRNIVVTGTDEPAPNQLEGGHFMIFMTPTPQYIEGVRFHRMGQQGNLGRYPVHFHINGNSPMTVCRKNTIDKSKQRCIVVHASHNMTIEQNVAYDTRGHCFLVEEGGEQGNTFKRNIGIVTNAVTKKISNDETDDSPATFWISNPQNNLLENVAAGSADSGFWIELRGNVRGDSLSIPALKDIIPILNSLGNVSGNVAHSNDIVGFRTYPNGIRPRSKGDWNNYDVPGVPGRISQLNLYKNGYLGMFVHNTDYLTITDSVFADNYWSLFLHQDNLVSFTNSRVVALTGNWGNPVQCWSSDLWIGCRPVIGCKMPLRWGQPGRSVGIGARTAPVLGVVIDVDSRFQSDSQNNKPNHIKNIKFSGFNSTCWTSAAITLLNNGEGEYWNSAHNGQALTFSSDSNPVWTPPRFFAPEPWPDVYDGLEASQFYNFWDKDGSIIGSPGYVVTNNSKILPPAPKKCTANKVGNAYYCPGTCYRTVQVKYIESTFKVGSQNNKNSAGSYSYVQVTRVSDGSAFTVYGNINQTLDGNNEDFSRSQRFFAFSVLAGQTYVIRIVPGSKSPSGFFPSNITAGYLDYTGCGQGLTLRFQPQVNKLWVGSVSNQVFYKQCPGTDPLPATAQHGPVCINGLKWTEVVLGTDVKESVILTQGTGSTACILAYRCSVLWSGQPGWRYNASGKELRPSFYNPLADVSSWGTGKAPLGYFKWDAVTVATQLPPPGPQRVTYYFRKSFNLRNTACITQLQLESISSDGFVIYLNNKELLRHNLPPGPIKNSTKALSVFDQFPLWKSFSISLPSASNSYFLVEGLNHLAVEQHLHAEWVDRTATDVRISAIHKGGTCSGAFITPEICDGVDNNNNGKVDEDANGKPLTQACSTACGTGTATCIRGSYQNCTAPPSNPEVCNGIDDNCDGLVDNGGASLNCGSGKVCLKGKCLPVTAATSAARIWPRNSSGWYYYDKGGNLPSSNPGWHNGSGIQRWSQGTGPLGYDFTKPPRGWNKFGKVINYFANDGVSTTAYFAKSFSLSKAQLAETYNIDFSIRRVDGAVVYVNGVEAFRTNLPSGKVGWNTLAIDGTGTEEWSPGSNCCNLEWSYLKCDTCGHSTAYPLKVGTNWIAAEVHVAWYWKDNFAFDMDAFRGVTRQCSSLPGSPSSCARKVHQYIFPFSTADWKYVDATLPLPPASWTSLNFNHNTWKTGMAPLGYGPDLSWYLNTTIYGGPVKSNARIAYYFRKVFQVPDAGCYLNLNSTFFVGDGIVAYINGVEAFRHNLPSDEIITSTTYASEYSDWVFHSVVLSGGWLKPGSNVIAVELHRKPDSTNIFFDLQLEGEREGVTCSPLPV